MQICPGTDLLHCLTGHFRNHHVRAFVPAQPGDSGAPLQEQRDSEENHDHHRASSSLLQHRRHPPSQPKVQTTLVLFVMAEDCLNLVPEGLWASCCQRNDGTIDVWRVLSPAAYRLLLYSFCCVSSWVNSGYKHTRYSIAPGISLLDLVCCVSVLKHAQQTGSAAFVL